MEEFFRLKTRLESLSKNEFITFIKSQDHRCIMHLLFHALSKQLLTITDTEEYRATVLMMKQMTSKIDNIIYSRDNNKTQHEEEEEEEEDIDININPTTSKINLNKLSSILVSHISGYLQFKDLISFEKVNRNTFIASRSPIIQNILNKDLFIKCIKYSNNNTNKYIYNLYRFRNIKSIEIDIRDGISPIF